MSADQSSYFDRPRFVVKKVLAKPQHEGQGAVVRRSIGRLYISILISFFFFRFIYDDHPHRRNHGPDGVRSDIDYSLNTMLISGL